MNLYIQSDTFIFFHLPITIFLFFLFGEKLKKHVHWLLIISLTLGAVIQINNLLLCLVILTVTATNWIARERKNGLIVFNITTWIMLVNFKFILKSWVQGDEYLYPNLNILNINNWLLMFFFLMQIYLIKSSTKTIKFTNFALASLLPLIALPLTLPTSKKWRLNPKLTKEKLLSFNFFCLALILKLIFIIPFETWAKTGIHAGFSLNIVQAWALLFFNSASIIFNITYALLFIKGFSIIFSSSSVQFKSLKEELYTKVLSPYYKIVEGKNSFYTGGLIAVLTIILFSGLNWYQMIGIPTLLFSYWIFLNNSSILSKYFKFLMIGLVFLFLFTNTFIELKVMLTGLVSLPTLFIYYNEYYIFHGFNSEPLTALILVTLTILIFKSRNQIYFFAQNHMKYSIIILYPLLSLIQLS